MTAKYIIGVDEVGMGALAGPMCVCAFAATTSWNQREAPAGLRDSKKMSERERSDVNKELIRQGREKLVFYNIQHWTSKTIDTVGIGAAHKTAVQQAVQSVLLRVYERGEVDAIIMDGNLDFTHVHAKMRSVVKADSLFPVVSAASVIAKEHRDGKMVQLENNPCPSCRDGHECLFPVKCVWYGFSQHKGYPTKLHYERLGRHGPSQFHRKTYGPIEEMLNGLQKS